MAETDEKQRLKAEIRKLEEALAKLDGENRRLLDRNEELQLAYDEADRDAREAEAMNGHLLRRVEEMEVQIAALRQYEAEFDKRVTSMLDERDEALASATRDKEAILLKVKELQEELALARRSVPGEAADAAELALMLKERQLEIEDLLDRNEELEHDLAKAREELQRAPRQAPTSAGTQPSGGLDQTSQDQYEERLRHFKADALEKDQRVLDAEKKLEQLARSLGAEGVVAENRELSRQNADMKRQVGEAKRDLANYLSEAANIVYENDLLRSIANVKPEQLKLKDFKLKDKVTSAKAVAAAKQMEKEVAELEAERGKLKARLRQLSELAAEKVSLLHNLQPEQMLQLEEIAARMRKGKLELPLDDQSRQLKEERDELSKRLAAKDREVAEHVDRKVEEVLKKQGATKDLEAKVAALEKDNEMLQSSLEAYKAGYAELVMQQGPQALEQLVGRLPGSVPLPPGAMARSLRPLPPGITPPPPGPAGRQGLGAPAVLPKMPGMQPMVWSSLLQAVLQLPGELSDGSQETVCSLYCQVVEALEELSRERSLREGLAEEVSSFQQRFDRLLAEQEVLYKDYFAQREEWLATTRSLEERLRLQGDLLTDCQQKCEIQEGQMRTWQRLAEGTAPELQEELVSAMGRIAALEQNESVLSRKVEAERQGHSIVKEAFDNLQKDCCEREGFLKERLSKAVLWKRRGANALRIARRKIQSMVASSDYERVQQQLQVCRQREFDLSRRQTELTLKVAQQEDKLREMMDLQDRCRSLDHLVRETEQEFTVLRRRLQLREPRFAAEVALFTRLTAELQRTLGFVGSFEAAARALGLAEARVAGLGFEAGAAINVEASLDEKLRKFDVNNDGFITLGDLRKFFESLSIKVKEDELQLLAEALHGAQSQVTAPRPPPSAPGSLSPPAPPEPTAADKVNVSVLGVVGRFRLYGLRSLEPEELFWASFQALLFRLPDQPDAQQVLRSSFMRLRNAQGDIAAADVVSVLASYEVPANQLPLRSLRRVLQWLGVEARSLEEVLPAAQLPNPGDAQEPEFRLRLQKLRIVYQDFAQRMEKGLGRAQLQLRPPEALVVPAPPSPPADLEARCHAAQARESAANRRCVVLEQEVRTKDRIAKELQRQVGELDNLVERLESELYEERGRKVNLMAQLNASLPKAEVEPKLRQLEELKFQVDQSSLALKQSKDLARVCAAQAESYEQLVKRRQQEVRNLQESVKMLQAGDEVANTVGKLQYRLLLCQWEKGNVQRQLQTATQDLRQARRELLENEEQVEQERQEHDHTEEHLRHRLTEASAQAAQLAEQSAAAMPVDKARQLTSRLEEISSRKMELEERLSKVRLELLRNQAETDSCRLRAQQAQELLMELKALDPDSEAPRQRLLEMAKKLADSKLQELQHKRSLEIVKEQHQQLEKARQADEKEIQNLQREVANAESKLADQEQQWRAKVLEAQGAAPASAVRRAGQISIEALEEIQGKVSERDARIAVLESDLQKSMSDRESAVAEERAKVRKLELELGLVAEGDMAKLRQALRAEHDAEVAQISQAAQESVQTLQQLLDQTEEHLQRQQQDTARLHQNLSEQRAKHAEETMQLQQEIAGLRQEIFQIRHHQQSDVGASARLSPLPPPPPDESARLGDSIGSEAFGGMEGLGNRLDEQREQVVSLHHRLEQQHEEFQSLLDQQHQEARRREEQLRGREERLHQEYQAREQRLLDLQEAQRQQRDQELLRIKEELASLHSANGANAEAQQQREEQVAEAQRHADLALQHNAVAEQNRLSAENWQRKATELEAELQKERQKHQESTMRKQQASLRRQLANKEEQLGSLRKAVEELKDRVVQLTIRNEREEMESGNARRSESEVRKRITGQEGKMQSLKDQVARLSKQLQEQKAQATHEAARAGELDSREAALAQLLEASASQLAEKAAEARRFEELLLRQTRRATEAEEALRGERGVAEGEVKLVMKEGQAAAEANARRVGALLERLEALQAERLELSSKLHGAEAALAVLRGTARGGASVEAVANMAALKERLREEQDLRQALQEEVRDLSTQLEMAGPRVDQKTLSSPSPLRELTSQAPGSPLRQGTSRSGSRSPPASRSPAPRSLKQASELAARCGQLQAEVAALKARSTVLEQENDDLKLRVASDADPVTASAEIDMLRGSLENVNAQNRVLTTEIEAERLRHHAIYRRQGEEEELRRLQQQLNQAYQSLAAERQRISVLSQALEVERHMRVAPNTSDSSSAVALATARATIADLQQRLDEALKARVQLPPTGQPPREAELVAQVEELLRENTQLRRQVASPGAVRASAEQQVLQLQARIQELLRENMALQRAAESAPLIPPVPATPVATAVPVAAVPVAAPPPATAQPHPDTAVLMALQQQVAQLQARVQELLRENLDMQRRSPSPPPASGDAASLAAARRQNEELQARLQTVLRENLELQRRQSPAPSDAAALAAARRQIEELQARVQELASEMELQRRSQSPAPPGEAVAGASRQNAELQGRVQELLRENLELQGRSSDIASAAGATVRRQNEELQVRVQELLRENLELQRYPPPPPGAAETAGALAAAKQENEQLQGRVQELQRENNELWRQVQAPPSVPDDFGALDRALGAAKRQNEELEARVQELLRENLQLQRRSPSPPPDAPGEAALAAARHQNDELQVRMQGVLRDNLELQRRSPSPPGDAARQKNEELQARCFDLIKENDALRQQLAERSRDGSPHRSARRPAAEALRLALQRQELSLVKLLTGLDPQMHGKVSFEAFQAACSRHHLSLQADDFAKLAHALNLDKRGFFHKEALLRAFRRAEEVASPPRGRKAPDGPSQTQSHARSGSREVHAPQGLGPVEVQHRRQIERLESRLFASEQERQTLQQELDALRRQESAREEALQKPRSLSVLLSAGDTLPPFIKELKLEVKGTRELRDKLYNAETQLESYKRRLEVDARQELEKERHVVKQLQAELEEKERTVAELLFDLRRARNASGEGDWAQREEEYMRLDLQLRKLEEELASSRRAERDMADRLLQAEHVAMELRFDREQVHLRSSRLESRILELELLNGGDSPRRQSPLKTGAGAAAANLQSRKERNLENVIEGLERVVNQQKAENQRLKVALDRRPDDRRGRGRAEVERLRKRIEELESAPPRGQDSGNMSAEGPVLEAYRREVAAKEEVIQKLQEKLREGPGTEPPEMQRLLQELAELRRARGEDGQALDEAQRALQEAEMTEKRYLEVVRENRKLRQDLSALEDDGFWKEIESLQTRNQEAVGLAKESQEALLRCGTAAGVDVASLMARLETFAAAG